MPNEACGQPAFVSLRRAADDGWFGVIKREAMLQLRYAESPEDLEVIRVLFREYEAWLGFDLCFQGFEQELATLPGAYAPPSGRLLLASHNGSIAGCIGLRRFGDWPDICEMKRLFVREPFRGLHIGRALSEAVIDEARQIGYSDMRLDTLERMKAARALYISLGFKEITAYRFNPIEGAIFMELSLKDEKP